jgi:hypothetical protein
VHPDKFGPAAFVPVELSRVTDVVVSRFKAFADAVGDIVDLAADD